jgi:hypothetical protein
MAVLTLDEIKAHLRLDGSEEDAHLTLLNEAAQDYASQYMNRAIPWHDDVGAEQPVPASVKAAILLTIGDLYENRESAFVGVSRSDNPTAMRLLYPYRVGLGI